MGSEAEADGMVRAEKKAIALAETLSKSRLIFYHLKYQDRQFTGDGINSFSFIRYHFFFSQ